MAQRLVDLRSDTVTRPTPAMRRAMAEAEVGDDHYGDDPTVNRLEARAAAMLGKEAAMYVPSGTMGNLAAVLTHCGRGQEVVMGSECHIFHYELGGTAALGGLPWQVVRNTRMGVMDLTDLAAAIKTPQGGESVTGVLCLENTHNRCGGVPITPDDMRAMADIAHAAGVPVHLDGARVFNAAAALGVPVAAVVREMDSVQFCFSKGLAAPVGSILVGAADFIARARRTRRMLGGAMRQAGVIAAAAYVALTEMTERLPEDHARARRLAQGLGDLPGIAIDLDTVQTNIVYFKLDPPNADFVPALRADGIMCNGGAAGGRLVTHYEITDADIDATLIAARHAVLAAAR